MALWIAVGVSAHAQAIHGREGINLPPPPAVEAIPVEDDYFGTKITDNYRWLEDGKSPETRAFIDEQNAYTARYMKQARIRPQILDDLDDLEHISQWSLPIERAGNYYFTRRLVDEDRASICVRRGWTAKDERLVDPGAMSRDPNTSVDLKDVSRDGTLLAYSLRQGGADETSIHIFNVKTGKTLEDELSSARYGSVAFAPDGASIYYARIDKAGTLLYQHVLGTRPSRDTLVFGREFHDEELGPSDPFSALVTDDAHYLVVEIRRGLPAHRVDIVFRDLTKPGAFFQILVWGLDSRFSAACFKGAWFVMTDYKAPNGRIFRADPGIMPEAWKLIVPEGSEVMEDFSIVGGKLYVRRLRDAQPETAVYALDGKPAGKIDSDGIGTFSAVQGLTSGRYGFFSFESFVEPPILYRLDTVTGKREVFAQSKVSFDPIQYDLKQAFFKLKDGTQIPMFIAGKKGLKQDGTERLLMTGFGGFNISETPIWNPAYAWWLEQGGWLAVPSLRGGGEYGEKWHQQGKFERKQNVFDDWFAAAEYLIANKYTSSAHFAIAGRGNGGLLMGASIVQRPELFSAVWCGNPLLDMLRYQKFSVGSYWKSEYGSSDDEKQFPYLRKYSPYNNIKPGTAYPAVIFFTGDNGPHAGEASIDPLHARKMTALLQSALPGGRPVLLHTSIAGNRSEFTALEQQIQDDADQLAFLWTETAQPSTHK